jgi:DNA-binding LacI/PurR family transcriptional regulator
MVQALSYFSSGEVMKHRSARPGARAPVKLNRILDDLRRQIVTGRYPPGARLPLRRQMQKQMKVSTATLQSALNRLIEDGFVEAHGRRGTRVAPAPPHLTNFALVLPRPPGPPGTLVRSQCWSTLSHEAAAVNQKGNRRVIVYSGVDGHSDTESFQKLLGDMRSHRIAGLVLAFMELADIDLDGSALLLEEPEMPRVAITTNPEFHGLPVIRLDYHSFIDRALDHFATRKRKRLGVLAVTGTDNADLQHVRKGAAARKIQLKDEWMQCVGWPETHWSRNLVQMMLSNQIPRSDRPDALLVMDDNIAEHTMSGLIAAGVKVPEDVEVVCHANFPCQPPRVLPVRHLGFDISRALQLSVETIDRQRRGQSAAGVTKVTATFEEELGK